MLTNSPQVVSETAQNVFEQFLTEMTLASKYYPSRTTKCHQITMFDRLNLIVSETAQIV